MTVWRLNQVSKNACLAEIGAVFKYFSVFPRTFVTVHLLSKLPPFQTLRESIFNPHWCFISYPNHQEKVWALLSQSHFTYFMDISFTVWIDIVFETFLSLCDGYGLLCLLCSHFFHVEWSQCVFHCSDICLLLSLKIFS